MPANLTTKLGQLVDVLTPDTTNTRIGVANASPTRTLDVTGTGGFTGLLTANGGVKVSASSATTDSFTNTDTNTGGKEWRFGATTSAGNWSVYNATDAIFGLKIANSGTVTLPGALIVSGQLYAIAAFGSQLAASKTTNNGASTIFKVPYSSQCYTQYRVRVFCSNNTVQPNYSYQSTEYNIIVADSSATNVTTISTISSTQFSINGGVINLTFALTSATAAGFTTFTTTVSITGAAGATGAYTYYQIIPMGSEQTTLPTAL
jgi:hypothetical protein